MNIARGTVRERGHLLLRTRWAVPARMPPGVFSEASQSVLTPFPVHFWLATVNLTSKSRHQPSAHPASVPLCALLLFCVPVSTHVVLKTKFKRPSLSQNAFPDPDGFRQLVMPLSVSHPTTVYYPSPVNLSSISTYTYIPIYPSIHPSMHQPINPSSYLPISSTAHLSTYPSIYSFTHHPHTHLKCSSTIHPSTQLYPVAALSSVYTSEFTEHWTSRAFPK